ncbi:hypothetical protein L1077_21685 [Pseudoalteromonas luteoviolacea]|uniref:hypothetical protein n=1 Tax=Pseudoalteromonas luteoviolacea TaxID=43657 RepID=UPI001F1C53F1|nr:hypothetical protein [Pseudoalteromonas luteoviolacea]MCF6442046.1 hypothetical protein [Pseudoalteromonas luteoviolacea]
MAIKTQKDRLQAIITGDKYWTLEEVCDESRRRFKKTDTPAAMSARWRNVHESPFLTKHKRVRKGTSRLYEYRIQVKEAANSDQEVA